MGTIVKLTIILFATLALLAYSIEPRTIGYIHPTTLKQYGLNGPVKTLIEEASIPWNHGISVTNFSKQGKLTEIRYFIYKDTPFDYATFLSTTQDYSELDTTDMILLRKESFKYNSKGLFINEQHIDSGNILNLERTYNYDLNDSLLQETIIYYGTTESPDSETIKYHYYSNIYSQQKIIIKDNNDTLLNLYTYFDEKGSIVKYVKKRNDNSYEIKTQKYIRNKLLQKVQYFNFDSITKVQKLESTEEYKYNWLNNLSYTYYFSAYRNTSSYQKFRFNRLKKSHFSYNPYDKANDISNSIFFYDIFGNIIKVINNSLLEENNKKTHKTRVDNFTYDKYHNVIEIFSDINGNRSVAYRAKISYYN